MHTIDSSLHERLKHLEDDLAFRPPRFVRVQSMPYALFHYHPQDERELRRALNNLAPRLRHKGWRVHFLSLARLLWKAIEESEGLEALLELERAEGFQAVQEQVFTYLTEDLWSPLPRLVAEAIDELPATDPARDLVFLYRAGVFAPHMYRISGLINELATYRVAVPVVLFYPGTREGTFGLRYMDLKEREVSGNYRVQVY